MRGFERSAGTGTVLVVHPGAELYGSDRMLLESVVGLRDEGRRVVVVLPGSGPLVEALQGLGVEVVQLPFPVLRKAALRPRGAVRLVAASARSLGPALAILRRTRPEAVYVSTLTIPSWLLLGRLARTRTVCHVHEAERHPNPIVTRALVTPLLLAHHLILNSRFSASVLTDSVPSLAGRIVVVPNGVGGPRTPTPPRPTVQDGLRVLCPGRVSPRKGTDVAVRAVASTDGPDRPRLHVLGSVFPGYEWFEEALREEAAALLSEGTVRMTQFTPDVWSHVAEADLVVVPSTAPEPFGNTAVEALLAGRPVIVSDIGGLPEAVHGSRAALRVPPGDPAALAGAIAEVRRRWSELSEAAWGERDEVARRFSPAHYRRQVAAVCLTGRPGDSSPTRS